MDYLIVDEYGPDVSGRACFITRRPVGMVDEVVPGGATDRRRERVVLTPRTMLFGDPPPVPGRIAIGESAVWEMGRLVGMVPAGDALRAQAELARAEARLEDAEVRLSAARTQIAALQAQIDAGVRL